MPTIPNYPQALLDQHHHWHSPGNHPEVGPGRVHGMGTSGGGLEFLTFHRNFVAQFMSWYNGTTFTVAPFNNPAQKASLVAPWTSVPAELKQAALGWTATWSADETRLNTLSPDFASADQLGTFIEMGIHNSFLHGASSAHFNEPVVGGFHSPQSTLFYKIHGLVDYWWSQWQMRHKRRIKELVKEHMKELTKEIRKELVNEVFKQRLPEIKNFGEEVKFAAREVPDDILTRIDPVVLENLGDRLSRLEGEAFPRSATFIRAHERPPVGEEIVEGPGEGPVPGGGGGGHG